MSATGSRFPRATPQPPRKKTTFCGVFTCCFSRRSRQHPLPSLKKYVSSAFFQRKEADSSERFLVGRVIAVPEEIHVDSCGNAQNREKEVRLSSRRPGVAITHHIENRCRNTELTYILYAPAGKKCSSFFRGDELGAHGKRSVFLGPKITHPMKTVGAAISSNFLYFLIL